MKNKQKFKRGNLVYIAKDLGPLMSHFTSGVNAIVVYSYAEQYGGENISSYSVMFLDDGNLSSWYHESQLTLVEEGGEHLFEIAQENRKKVSEKNKDISYILSQLDEGNFGSESILFLFDMLGYQSSFNRNGEFFILYRDWAELHPIFCHIKNAKNLEEAKCIFKPHALPKYNIEKVYKTFKQFE